MQAWHLIMIDVYDRAVAEGCRNMFLSYHPDTAMNWNQGPPPDNCFTYRAIDAHLIMAGAGPPSTSRLVDRSKDRRQCRPQPSLGAASAPA
jgi:hypothetical protein